MRYVRSLDQLDAVAAVARTDSPLQAARVLGCAVSSVYRAVERLERDAGQAIFQRTRSGWKLTDAGHEIVQLAERIQAEIAAAELRLVGKSRGVPAEIRISASDGLAGWFLAPVLAEYAHKQPNVVFDLVADNQFADLAHREADIAIRPDQRPGDDLVGRRAGKLAHALYGADSLLQRWGTPKVIADLGRFEMCALSERLKHFTAVQWAKGPASLCLPKASLNFNTETALADAITAGAGLGILPCFIGGRLKGVRRIASIEVAEPVDIWLVTHQALRGNSIIKSLIQHLAGAFRRSAPLFR